MKEVFRIFSQKTSNAAGSSWTFITAVSVVLLWAVSGPLFHFSETWQLIINTGTTIITFLMVFLVQNTQNRDARAMHIKLDELIHAQKKAHNTFMGVETKSDQQLEKAEHNTHKSKRNKPRKK